MIDLYGIPNCDTVKKARAWLAANRIGHRFHDFKKEGVEVERLDRWCDALGWETVLNRAGTTFRKLPEADKHALDRDRAVALMLAQPSMIKRPIVEYGDAVLAGFKPEAWTTIFS